MKMLESIPGQFEDFFVGLKEDVTKEHEDEEDRLVGVERYVQRIERSLVTEQQQRIDMLALVESNIQTQCDALKARARGHLDAMKPHIPIRLTAWNQRLDENETELDEELKRRRAAIERERQRLLKQLDDLQIRLEVEKVERLEREATLLKKVIDEVAEFAQLIDEERTRREATLAHIRDDNDTAVQVVEKPNAAFKEEMINRMVKATKDIRLETARRITAEKQFVQSLESYTKALQEGLHLVNLRDKETPEQWRK